MDEARKLGRLLKVISSAYDATKNAMLERYGLTSRQVDLLGFLRTCEGNEASQKEITEYLHTSCATTSGIIRRLAEKGLIERATSEGDKRANTVRLADGAAPVVDECVREFRDADGLVLAGLTEDEVETLTGLLERLLANAEALRAAQTR